MSLPRRPRPRETAGQDARLSFRHLIGETLHIAAARSGSLFWLAMIGLGGASLLGAAINFGLTIDVNARTGSYVGASANNTYVQLIVQAILGATVSVIARAAITWVALQPAETRPTGRAALQAGLASFAPQIVAVIAYGLIISVAVIGLTLFLRDVRLDQSNIGRVSNDPAQMLRAAVARTIGALSPDPGPPFTEVHTFVRYSLRRAGGTYASWSELGRNFEALDLTVWLAAIGGLGLIVAAEGLLRFRTIATLGARASEAFPNLVASMRWSAGRFWLITARVWAFRGLALVLQVIFVIVPVTIAQGLAVPAAAGVVSPALLPFPASTFLFALGAAPVAALLAAFGLVYDARLWLALRRA